jgi:hypothetical protein
LLESDKQQSNYNEEKWNFVKKKKVTIGCRRGHGHEQRKRRNDWFDEECKYQ